MLEREGFVKRPLELLFGVWLLPVFIVNAARWWSRTTRVGNRPGLNIQYSSGFPEQCATVAPHLTYAREWHPPRRAR